MNRRALATVVVAVSIVLAGCGAFAGGPSPTATSETASTTDASTSTPTSTAVPTATPESTPEPVPVAGDLPVNATLVWERVESMFPGEYEAPRVAVRDAPGVALIQPFASHLGLDDNGTETFSEERPGGGYNRRQEYIEINPRNGSDREIESILAHEFAHAIQYQTGFRDRAADRRWSAERAVVEGSATYTEDAYTREYLGFSAIDRACEAYMNGSSYARYLEQHYCFGGQYFAEKLDSPSELLDPDLSLPDTTEQVLEPERTDRPENFTVTTESERVTPAERDRQGELFVRTVLGVELPEQRASEAAKGWGNDRLLEVTGDTEGYVWVLRWDTDEDADEFENTFAEHLDARGNETDDGWGVDDDRYRLTTVDDRMVAVVTGNESFVDAVSVTERDGNVTVSTARNR